MPEKKRQVDEGNQSERNRKEYQPTKHKVVPIGESKPLGGYQPTKGSGDGPVKKPEPPGDE